MLHQGPGASPAAYQQSIRSAFTSVMMDDSLHEDAKTPASYQYNGVRKVNIDTDIRLAQGARIKPVPVKAMVRRYQ